MTIEELYQTMHREMGTQHWLEPGVAPRRRPGKFYGEGF